jgi:hypothetical protein
MSIPKTGVRTAVCIVALLMATLGASAFNDPIDSTDALTVRIEAPGRITDPTTSVNVHVVIENKSDGDVSGTLRVRVIDDWSITPQEPAAFTLSGGASEKRAFTLTPGPGLYSTLYPMHAYVEHEVDGATQTAHPILIFDADFPEGPKPDKPEPAPEEWREARTRPEVVLEGIVTNAGEAVPIAVLRGKRGLLDARVRFGDGSETVEFRGLSLKVGGSRLFEEDSPYRLVTIKEEPVENGYCMRHGFKSREAAFDLLVEFGLDDRTLQLKVWLENTPEEQPWEVTFLENVALGEWSKPIHRVYAGPGNVIEAPKIFTPGFEGHRLSTSHVGADFDEGPSLVLGVDVPPERLRVVPEDRVFTLDTPHAQTLTFIPGTNVWEAAKVWRELDGREPAGGVKKLAGRFTFDLWRSDFSKAPAQLEQAFRYGLTDAVVVWHRWQRWGYDYRLPDIMPPNPKNGGSGAFQALAQTCRDHGVLFAPHDNYIDFYPDSELFTYDRVAFYDATTPIRAWRNTGRGAQSFRWRPDLFQPFMEANVRSIRDAFAPTAYFIDVWASRRPYDYWTRDGAFHTCMETRDIWRDTFAWIRDELGNDAPQISESGNDLLIGWADAGQANHLRVDESPPESASFFVWRVKCKDAERIPWFDFAHHHRFVLQGAGYSSRYQAGLDGRLHGIYSDDYMATEVLAGRSPMVSGAFGRDVVRKYWLLQRLNRALAMRQIESVEFVDDNLHRQHVRWDNGTEVWVNRGEDDWTVGGRVLPPYGFYARAPQGVEAAIERREGLVVEWAQSEEALYVNARGARTPVEDSPEVMARRNPNGLSVRFGAIRTAGGLRLTRNGETLEITPLPDGVVFDAQIDWDSLPWSLPQPVTVTAQQVDGSAAPSTPVEDWDGQLALRCSPEMFKYCVSPE